MKEKPKITPARRPKAKPAASKSTRSRGRLLLVEDHEPTRAMLHRLLKERCFDVKVAATIAEAWALVEEHEFDLLVSDIGLPDGDGYLLMHKLRARCGLKGIALTGYDLEEDMQLSKEAGFTIHLTKPIQIKLLDQALLEVSA